VGDALRRKDDLPGSKKYYLLALKLRPQDPFALMGLGNVCEKMGNDEEALFYFNKLFSSADYSTFATTSAANIYRKTGNYEKAIELYDAVLAGDSKNSHAWNGKADCFRGMRKYEAAIHAWNNAQKHGMNRASAMTRIGDCYLSMNDLDNAEISYQITVAAGYDKYAYLGMLRIHLKRNHINEAFETLMLLKKHEPHDTRISAEYNCFIERYPHMKGQ
jgi:tetratricopeptide (TPR) repeat protein